MSIRFRKIEGEQTLGIQVRDTDGIVVNIEKAYNINEAKIALVHFYNGHKVHLRKCPLCRGKDRSIDLDL